MYSFREMVCLRTYAMSALICLGMTTSACAIQISETFDVDPMWDGSNNTSGNSSFGFSDTNNTGAASGAGEIGGAIGNTLKSYYADDVSSLDPSTDSLSMTGTLWTDFVPTASDGQTFLGWFDKDGLGSENRPNNFLGIYTLRDPPYQLRALVQVDGGHSDLAFLANLGDSISLTYDLTYNPNANGGDGSMVVSINGGAPSTINLAPGRKDALATFDRFGLVSDNPGISITPITVFHDDITYTSGVPEPTSVALLAIGCVAVAGLRRRDC